MARRTATGHVQASVYNWLRADSALAALAPVYDQVPQSTPYPYVEIGELIETPDNTEGQQGREVLVSIFAWSQKPGFLELERICDELLRLLDEDQIPDVSPSQGWSIQYNQMTRNEVTRLDGITRQLAIQVSVLAVRTILGE